MAETRFAFPPAGMDAETAAYYLGIGRHAFLGQVAAGEAPQPIQATPRCRIWLREDLDRYLLAISGAGPRVNWVDPQSARPHHEGATNPGW